MSVFADNCALLVQNPNEFFTKNRYFGSAEFYCDGSILNMSEIKDLLNVVKDIRGDSEACLGNNVVSLNLNTLKLLALKASFAPEIYAKTLKTPEISEQIKDNQRAQLRYWGYQNFYNFLRFKEFNRLYNDAQTPLVKFYEKKGYDTQSAAYYATSVLNDFLDYAVGGYPEFVKGKDISIEQKSISDKNAGYELILSILYAKQYTQNELYDMFKTALLLNKSQQVIDEMLKIGIDIESGDENALFYALGSIENVKLLIQNGINVRHKNSLGESAIFYAVLIKDAGLVKLLLENGADVNDKMIDDSVKNMIASMGHSLPFYVKLCALEHTNETLFMYAAANSTPEILKILIDFNADINALDSIGFNALDHAKKAKNIQNIRFLESIGLRPNI